MKLLLVVCTTQWSSSKTAKPSKISIAYEHFSLELAKFLYRSKAVNCQMLESFSAFVMVWPTILHGLWQKKPGILNVLARFYSSTHVLSMLSTIFDKIKDFLMKTETNPARVSGFVLLSLYGILPWWECKKVCVFLTMACICIWAI